MCRGMQVVSPAGGYLRSPPNMISRCCTLYESGSSLTIFTHFEKIWIYPNKAIRNLGIKERPAQHLGPGWLRAATRRFDGDANRRVLEQGTRSPNTRAAI